MVPPATGAFYLRSNNYFRTNSMSLDSEELPVLRQLGIGAGREVEAAGTSFSRAHLR